MTAAVSTRPETNDGRSFTAPAVVAVSSVQHRCASHVIDALGESVTVDDRELAFEALEEAIFGRRCCS